MELAGVEPATSRMRIKRSFHWATTPFLFSLPKSRYMERIQILTVFQQITRLHLSRILFDFNKFEKDQKFL